MAKYLLKCSKHPWFRALLPPCNLRVVDLCRERDRKDVVATLKDGNIYT
jgi:hypothetical protein